MIDTEKGRLRERQSRLISQGGRESESEGGAKRTNTTIDRDPEPKLAFSYVVVVASATCEIPVTDGSDNRESKQATENLRTVRLKVSR